MVPLLMYSSVIFITNALSAFYKKYYIYGILFICLTMTSLLFHYHNNVYTSIVDKLFVFAIVVWGGGYVIS